MYRGAQPDMSRMKSRVVRSAMSKRAEFWLWWFTDESGRRRRTSYRMSREVALKQYPDAEPISGTMEIRVLPRHSSEQPHRSRLVVPPPDDATA